MKENQVTRRKFIVAAIVGSTTLWVGFSSSLVRANAAWAQLKKCRELQRHGYARFNGKATLPTFAVVKRGLYWGGRRLIIDFE